MSRTSLRAFGALLFEPAVATAQRPTLSAAVKQYVTVDTPVVALTHVRVIDGTGECHGPSIIALKGGVKPPQ